MAPRAASKRARPSGARVAAGAAAWLAAVLLAGAAQAQPTAEARKSSTPETTDHVATHHRPVEWPLEFPGSQYTPLSWREVAGWSDDDPLPAFKTFRASCKPIAAQNGPLAESKALGTSLRDPCIAARAETITDSAAARAFFERQFVPLLISRVGEDAGFVTGYYEPIVDGSRVRTDVYTVPVYRRPSNLFVRGYSQASAGMPNKGQVFRKIGRRKLVPYYDRGEIEDGAIAGRGLEVVWLKSQTDLLFMQIQGSARVRLEDGSMVRLNYDAHNGYPYTPVGRVLIERNIVPKEQMSMQRIREYMEQNPDAAQELRRQNRSYVFFREVALSATDEAVGAQGVPLTAGRSIAVDKSLHVYGTPFFIAGDLPLESEASTTPFRRLMVAQDTGSAIIGPARADIYFGAGGEAGRVAGRLKNPARFVMLLPKSLDPVARGKTMPLPQARPSAVIAKLFPQKEIAKEAANELAKTAAPQTKPAESPAAIVTAPAGASDNKAGPPTTATTAASPAAAPAQPVPLPEQRPAAAPASPAVASDAPVRPRP